MKLEIQNRLNEFVLKNKTYNCEWYVRFFQMLEDCGVDDKIVNFALDLLDRPDNHVGYSNTKRCVTLKNKWGALTIENFFNYMENMVQEIGVDSLKEFLENSIIQMGMDFGKYAAENHSNPTNFFNLFMRQLIKTNPQDVMLDDLGEKMQDLSLESGDGCIEISIAGVAIGHIHFQEIESATDCLAFTEFRTLPGLERLGLGSVLISELCRQVCEHKPEHMLIATNVAKGHDGDKAYSAWGGYPVMVNYADDGHTVIIDDKPMSKEYYDSVNHSLVFAFPNSAVKALAEKENTRYTNTQRDTVKIN